VRVRSLLRVRPVPVWLVAAAGGLLVLGTGWLPVRSGAGGEGAAAVTGRAVPVLVFLTAVTVLAELADRAGVFVAAADGCARLARGSVPGLFGLVAALGTVTTVVLSLDTTAVLLTPVVLRLTGRLGLRPLPFALLAVWLANTASLLLPVSNLTNLLAAGRLGLSATGFAGRMLLPELAAVLVTVLVLGVLFRRDLTGRYPPPAHQPVDDPVVFTVAAGCCVLLAPFVVAGVPPYLAATPAAVLLAAVFAVRRPRMLRVGLLPWRLVLLTEGLFLVVTAAANHLLRPLLTAAVGGGVLRTAGVAAAASNLLNNLPAYLALEQAVPAGTGGPGGHTTDQLLGVLLGTNLGPLVLLWGSLATLLWRERCRAHGLVISPWEFARVGLLGVPLLLLASWAALQATGG